jgi:peroxiredoxin
MTASSIPSTLLSTGMAAPEFEAVACDGRAIALSALRRQGPVMLVFLRGFG